MYIKWSDKSAYNQEIKQVQHLLNKVRTEIKSSDRDVSDWPALTEDGYFGQKTANALSCFQNRLGLVAPEYGVIGDTTYGALSNFKVSDLKDSAGLLGSNAYLEKKNQTPKLSNRLSQSSEILFKWTTNKVKAGKTFITVVDGVGKVLERFTGPRFLHIDWNTIIAQILLNKGWDKKVIHLNNKDKFRQFTAYGYSDLGKLIGKLSYKINVVNLGFDLYSGANKAWNGQLQIVDVLKGGKDVVETIAASLAAVGVDVSLKEMCSMSTIQVLKKLNTQIGNIPAKVWMPRIASKGVAAIGGSVCVVAAQGLLALEIGCGIGNVIEKNTHIGETAVNFYWDLFLGAWMEKFFEWKVNRVVMLAYPLDWTEEDIKKFHESVSYYQ